MFVTAFFALATLLVCGTSAEEVAHASHILVKTEEKAQELMKEIEAGLWTFEEAAKKYSECPSGAEGGDLGSFGKGQMVPEFEVVIFDPTKAVGKPHGPVKTDFGYHLILIHSRSDEDEA